MSEHDAYAPNAQFRQGRTEAHVSRPNAAKFSNRAGISYCIIGILFSIRCTYTFSQFGHLLFASLFLCNHHHTCERARGMSEKTFHSFNLCSPLAPSPHKPPLIFFLTCMDVVVDMRYCRLDLLEIGVL